SLARRSSTPFCFFFHAPPTTEIYTLSLHDALPICGAGVADAHARAGGRARPRGDRRRLHGERGRRPGALRRAHHRAREELPGARSEEHTSELQSRGHLVCRLLLEKKKKIK